MTLTPRLTYTEQSTLAATYAALDSVLRRSFRFSNTTDIGIAVDFATRLGSSKKVQLLFEDMGDKWGIKERVMGQSSKLACLNVAMDAGIAKLTTVRALSAVRNLARLLCLSSMRQVPAVPSGNWDGDTSCIEILCDSVCSYLRRANSKILVYKLIHPHLCRVHTSSKKGEILCIEAFSRYRHS